MNTPDENLSTMEPTQQRDPPQGAAQHHTPPAHHQQEQKQPTALLQTIGCTGWTHSPAASPDLMPLRTVGCPGWTHLLAASPDLCTTPDNQLPWMDSLTCSSTRPFCASLPTDYPGTQMPATGRQSHIAPDHLARCCTGSARHRQSTRSASQRSSIPVISSLPRSSPKPSSLQGGDLGIPT
jgi:hypothetical protein